MSPRKVVETALRRGLDMIAVCDHNTSENAAATRRAATAAGGGLHVLAGMEVCTAEEVHVLTLFETVEQATALQRLIYESLPTGKNRPDIFGDQVVANEYDEVESFNDRLLIAATHLDLGTLVTAVRRNGGLAIAAHVDRPSYSILSQLGFIPKGMAFDALEVSRHGDVERILARHPDLRGQPIIRASDAHDPSEIGTAWTEVLLERPTLAELALAFRSEGGRMLTRVG